MAAKYVFRSRSFNHRRTAQWMRQLISLPEIKSEFLTSSRRRHPQVEPLLATYIFQNYISWWLNFLCSLQETNSGLKLLVLEVCWWDHKQLIGSAYSSSSLPLMSHENPDQILLHFPPFPLPFFHFFLISSSLLSSIKTPSNPFIFLIPPLNLFS